MKVVDLLGLVAVLLFAAVTLALLVYVIRLYPEPQYERIRWQLDGGSR